jgi:hypothetical protein
MSSDPEYWRDLKKRLKAFNARQTDYKDGMRGVDAGALEDVFSCEHINQSELNAGKTFLAVFVDEEADKIVGLAHLCQPCSTGFGSSREEWQKYFRAYKDLKISLLPPGQHFA